MIKRKEKKLSQRERAGVQANARLCAARGTAPQKSGSSSRKTGNFSLTILRFVSEIKGWGFTTLSSPVTFIHLPINESRKPRHVSIPGSVTGLIRPGQLGNGGCSFRIVVSVPWTGHRAIRILSRLGTLQHVRVPSLWLRELSFAYLSEPVCKPLVDALVNGKIADAWVDETPRFPACGLQSKPYSVQHTRRWTQPPYVERNEPGRVFRPQVLDAMSICSPMRVRCLKGFASRIVDRRVWG